MVDNRLAPTPSAAPAHRRMPWRNSPRSRPTKPARQRVLFRPRRQAGPGGNRVEVRLKPLSQRDEPQLAEVLEPRVRTSVRDHAYTLSDFLVPTLSIECEPCGRRGRYNVARLMEQYGDAIPELRHILANCQKARSQSIHDRCKVRYGEDSRPGPVGDDR